MSFTHKIMMVPLVAALAFGVLFVVGWRADRENDALIDLMRLQLFEGTALEREVVSLLKDIPYTLEVALNTEDVEMIDHAARLKDEFHAVLDRTVELPGGEAAKADTLRAKCDAYFDVARVATALMIETDLEDMDDAFFAKVRRMRVLHDELVATMDRISADFDRRTQERLTAARARADSLRRLTFWTVVLCLLSMAALSVLASWSIIRPIRRFREVSEDIAHGDLNTELTYRSPDDLGRLADAFRRMQHGLADESARRDEAEARLLERTRDLEKAVHDLRSTQAQLIQSEKAASLGQIAAGLAHELNNPLGALNASTDVMARAHARLDDLLAGDECARLLSEQPGVAKSLTALAEGRATAADASERVGTLVGGIKSFANLDQSELQMADPVQGLEAALTLLKPEFGERIELVRDYGDVPEITCFPAELNQVWLNLLSNAAEAIDGEGTVVVAASADERTVRVSVADNGRGMSADRVDSLFDMGFVESRERVKVGWGLATVYQAVRRHKGSIDVTSAPGEGSTFTVTLPRHLS